MGPRSNPQALCTQCLRLLFTSFFPVCQCFRHARLPVLTLSKISDSILTVYHSWVLGNSERQSTLRFVRVFSQGASSDPFFRSSSLSFTQINTKTLWEIKKSVSKWVFLQCVETNSQPIQRPENEERIACGVEICLRAPRAIVECCLHIHPKICFFSTLSTRIIASTMLGDRDGVLPIFS